MVGILEVERVLGGELRKRIPLVKRQGWGSAGEKRMRAEREDDGRSGL
jgi:hypothetical protein